MSVIGMIKNLIRWAAITAPSADNKKFPLHQITYMGKNADCLAWYPFGYHANPGAATLALMLEANADPENRVMFPGSPKERIDDLLPTPLAEDEILLFHPPTKSYIHFKADGTIDIDSQKDVNIRAVGNMVVDVEGTLIVNVEGAVIKDYESTVAETAEDDTTKVVTGDDTVTAENIYRVASTRFSIDANEIVIGDGSDDLLWILSTLLGFMGTTLHPGQQSTLYGYRDRVDALRP